MTTVTIQSSKPPITLSSGRGITITIDRSVTTSSGGGTGTVTSVTGTAPVVITGTPTTVPNVTIAASTTAAAGSMSAADKLKLDGIGTGATVTGVTGSLPISSSGGAAPVISIAAVTTVAAGSMSSSDKSKLDGIGTGATVTGVTGTAPIVSSGGAAPAISVTTGFAASTVAAGDDARIVAIPIFVSGQYTANTSAATTNAAATNNRLFYVPYLITTSTTFDRIAIEHTSVVAGASSVARLGIYNSTSGLPSTRLLDAGTIDLTTAAALKAITISQTLTPGLYYLAAVAQITSLAPQFRTAPTTISVPSIDNISAGTKFEAASGALPSTATPGTSNSNSPFVIYLRKA